MIENAALLLIATIVGGFAVSLVLGLLLLCWAAVRNATRQRR